jgi:NAD(P)-dependent dehydrogenase (short-subunit alcohol dehydrogenase family)
LEGAASPRRSAAVRYFLCELGNRHVLVNNAGIAPAALPPAEAAEKWGAPIAWKSIPDNAEQPN